MFGGITFAGAALAGVVGILGPLPAIDTGARIAIDGVPVEARVRLGSLTIRDILNDAPNTASFTLEGDGPAVGQRVHVTIGSRLLFAGAVQTVDQSYESLPQHVAWHVSAIDDTAEANARRPFGTAFTTSATDIAIGLTQTYAPGFATTGIEANLPPVTIVFDGADPFIACLARLATMIGGYCKIEDHTVYLFRADPADPPAPIHPDHRFLTAPPIQMNIDASQLRTRVYGKGYGESVQADLAPGETLIPIQDGVMFPPLGGTAIAGLTADGAQSEKLGFTSVDLGGGGSLVGPGAAPGAPPLLELQVGSGVESGLHTVSVAYVTASGRSLAGPPGEITAGTHAPPGTAPTASTAVNGTGPDQGSHDYAVAFVTSYGETIPSPISNAITTSAASGQLPAPPPLSVDAIARQGAGIDDGQHAYECTYVSAQGETTPSAINGWYTTGSQLIGQTDPVTPGGVQNGSGAGTTGGSIESNQTYTYYATYTTAAGETPAGLAQFTVPMGSGQNAATIPITVSPDPRVTGRKLYRLQGSGNSAGARLCATIGNNIATNYFDTVSQASIAGAATPPTVDTTANPGTPTPFNRLALFSIPIGPAGTTGRRIYRAFNFTAMYKLVTTIGNNTDTTYLDATANASLGAEAPTSNTTGTAVQRIPVSNIPLGPPGVTARKLYRRFNGAGTFKLVTTIANNTGTTYTDGVANSALGAAALTTATAIGNQILATLPKGASPVTAREIYMSPVANSIRRRIATIADNTTTSYIITASDATIAAGALEPGSDTSALPQPQGQVNPGATVIPVASSAPFHATGGWVTLAGGQTVRYGGVSGQSLVLVPASGSGSITTTVLYGSQALPAPMLVGVTGLTRPMLKGSAVHIWIQRDDLQAQAEHAARTGGDGIVEFLIVDARRGVESLADRCDADLARFSRPIVTVSYATRDLKSKSGKTVIVDLPPPLGMQATLVIQEVTITEIDLVAGLAPRFTVTASSVRFSLEDTLRRLIAGGQTTVNA